MGRVADATGAAGAMGGAADEIIWAAADKLYPQAAQNRFARGLPWLHCGQVTVPDASTAGAMGVPVGAGCGNTRGRSSRTRSTARSGGRRGGPTRSCTPAWVDSMQPLASGRRPGRRGRGGVREGVRLTHTGYTYEHPRSAARRRRGPSTPGSLALLRGRRAHVAGAAGRCRWCATRPGRVDGRARGRGGSC